MQIIQFSDVLTMIVPDESEQGHTSCEGPGWLNELGSWITQQIIQAYHQYSVGSRKPLQITKRYTRLASDKVYHLLAHVRWFSAGTPASSITKTGRHDIAEILLNVALNTKVKVKSHVMRL
jgi:hypothetical protein